MTRNTRSSVDRAARDSAARKLLLRVLVNQPSLSLREIAARLGITEAELADYEQGARMMPSDIQERLIAYVLAREPELSRAARRLRAQLAAMATYREKKVTLHATPRINWHGI